MGPITVIDPHLPARSPALSHVEYSYAFQPIVNTVARTVFSYEALLRGINKEPASHVFAQISNQDMHQFDEESRSTAIAVAARLGIACNLNLNFLPRSVIGSDRAVRTTLAAAEHYGIAIDRIILEVTEGEVIDDHIRFANVINQFRGCGLKVAIDDFGAGFCGLNLLADFQPDMVKLDMNLVRGINTRGPRQAIVRAVAQACLDLGIDLIVEGVEALDEYRWFRDEGMYLFQGYLLAKPAFENIPRVEYPPLL